MNYMDWCTMRNFHKWYMYCNTQDITTVILDY